MEFPQGFRQNIEQLLGEESEEFFGAMSRVPEVSLKLNRRKPVDESRIGYDGMERVKWCESGRYLESRPKFTLNPLMHAGVFYVQDASSMIYEAIVDRILPSSFDTGNPLTVLDLCAAPGGKTTSIINAVPDGTLVIANEFIPSRAEILKENLIKWGYPDFMVTNSPTKAFRQLGEFADIVAVDAPCSGEGMMRKEPVAVEQWGEGLLRQCARLQREILADAFETLKPGGFLIFSTCTFNSLENEENVRWLVEEKGLVPFDLDFPAQWGIRKGIDTPYPCMRFMPHLTRGEGLFCAVFRKEGRYPAAGSGREKLVREIEKKLKVLSNGIPRTVLKGRDTVAAPESALAVDFDISKYPVADLTPDQALSYLRHEQLILGSNLPRGFVVVRYEGFPLGFVNNLGNRANNLYPKQWRIRNL